MSVRLAYNWRDRFPELSGGSSGYTEEYESVDMNVSFNLDENLTLTYDGINLTEEGRRTFERNNPARDLGKPRSRGSTSLDCVGSTN